MSSKIRKDLNNTFVTMRNSFTHLRCDGIAEFDSICTLKSFMHGYITSYILPNKFSLFVENKYQLFLSSEGDNSADDKNKFELSKFSIKFQGTCTYNVYAVECRNK